MAVTRTLLKNNINAAAPRDSLLSPSFHHGAQRHTSDREKGRMRGLATARIVAIGFCAANNSPQLPFAEKLIGFVRNCKNLKLFALSVLKLLTQ